MPGESSPLSTSAGKRLSELVREKQRRSVEAMKIYRPMPRQEQVHRSTAKFRIILGGNRAGKSMCAFAEDASAATGQPIIGADGQPLPCLYPVNRPLIIWIVGWDESHIGKTIYRMLFRAAAFKMIRDWETKQWRQWRPWEPNDAAREDETKYAPPLIPPRLIDPKGWAWESKADRVFKTCRLRNGTEIHAFSSRSEPKQGDPVDLLHIDEDLFAPDHVSEFKRRLLDHRGSRFIWSAFPHSKNNALVEMFQHAERQADSPQPSVVTFQLVASQNPHIDQNELKKVNEISSEDEIRARDRGEFTFDNVLMYPAWNPRLHGIPSTPQRYSDGSEMPIREPKLERLLAEDPRGRWTPPDDWTRYLVVDPGHTLCAVMFAAIPPFGDSVVIYDELYLKKQDAYAAARAVRIKAEGVNFEAFLIDGRAGRQTPIGFSKRVMTQYAEAFESEGLSARLTGSSFIPGSDNVSARAGMVRMWLALRRDGTAKLRVVLANCPAFQKEMILYKKRVVSNSVAEDPVARDNHLMNCLEYLAAYQPVYFEPPPRRPTQGYSAYQRFEKEFPGQKKDNGSILIGPCATL